MARGDFPLALGKQPEDLHVPLPALELVHAEQDCGGAAALPGPGGVTGPAPGMIETLRRKALRKGADTLVVDSYDSQAVSGRTFRCGKSWYPPHLASQGSQPGAG